MYEIRNNEESRFDFIKKEENKYKQRMKDETQQT
jgi:hypothetical protein